jgi:acyl-CoA-binding protein
MTVADLKAALDAATAAYDSERDRLAAAGLKSKARYEALKPLKAAQDAANEAYVAAANRKVHAGLTAIIKQGSTESKTAQRARRAIFMYTK